VAFGANINAKNSFNQTPLDVAAENQVRSGQPHVPRVCVCGGGGGGGGEGGRGRGREGGRGRGRELELYSSLLISISHSPITR
jgi:hypothetical protein